MAKNETVRNSPAILKQDKDGYTNLESMSDYKPANDKFAFDKVKVLTT
jgi:hypothetical protein